MKIRLHFFFVTLFTLSLNGQVLKPIGINIAGVYDYSTELVFTDAFKQSRVWTPANADGTGPWSTNVSIPLLSNGYPVEIPYSDGVNPPQKVRSLMVWDIGSSRPNGNYRLIIEGTGEVTLNFGASGSYTCPIDTLVAVNGNVSLEIIQSDSNDPIRDIKFIYPNYVSTFQNQTFNADFLNFLEDFQVIRFMDWLETNNSTVATWADRSKKDYYTQTTHSGVAWEYVVELANTTNKDIWINIPHLADDDYIEQLANLLLTTLNSTSKIYLEYSNEVWNSQFSQSNGATTFGQNLGYTGQPWEISWKYTAKRSADIFHIFETVFGNSDRLIKTIPSQAANSWLSNQLVTYFNDPIYNPHQVKADAIVIAPYFAGSVANQIVTDNVVNTITIEEVVQRMQSALGEALNYMTTNKTVADNHQLDLVCYEAGQHLVGTEANVNIDELTDKLTAANRHPDLQDVYCQYLDNWYDSVGSLMVHFSSHGSYSKWGSWGIKQTMDDTQNPKYLAMQACVIQPNETFLSTPSISQPTSVKMEVYPNPATSEIHFFNDFNGQKFYIYDLLGQEMIKGVVKNSIDISSLFDGVYIIKVNGNSFRFVKK